MRQFLPKIHRFGAMLALATLILVSICFHHYESHITSRDGVDIPIEQLPKVIGDWHGTDTAGLDLRSQETLKLNRYVKRQYVNSKGERILLYIGYWAKQTGEHQAAKHSPLLCLPSNGWAIDFQEPRTLPLPASSPSPNITMKRVVGEIRGSSQLFYYWFFTGEANYSQEWRALLTISLQKFFTGRSDGGIVEVSTPIDGSDDVERSSEIIESFLKSFYPELIRVMEIEKNSAT